MKPTLGSSTLLDRLSHRRCDAAFIEALSHAPEARFLVLADQKPIILSSEARDKAAIRWFTRAELVGLDLPIAESLFLGVDREIGAGHFALAITEHRVRVSPGATTVLRPIVDLRSIAAQGVMPPDEVSLLGKAKALAAWHENTRCCGHCGGTTRVKDGGWKRKCWACGLEFFPRIDPVAIMLITDGERCVLGREAHFPENLWSALAGYVEPGEDLEHAVRRETLEEVGLEVGEVTFHSSQPWPFPHSLMIGCVGVAAPDPLKIDTSQVADARWFGREEVRQMLAGHHPHGLGLPGRQAIAHTLIRTWAGE
jgi:NAD+ diphosphatase